MYQFHHALITNYERAQKAHEHSMKRSTQFRDKRERE